MNVAAAAAAKSSSSVTGSSSERSTEAAISVGARSSLAAASGPAASFSAASASRAEHAEAPGVREVVVRGPAGELEQLLERRAIDRLGVVGLVGAAPADQLVDRHPPQATERFRGGFVTKASGCGTFGRYEGHSVPTARGTTRAAHRRDVQDAGGPARGRACHRGEPRPRRAAALVCSSWEAFAGELGQPSLRFVVQGQAPGLEVLAFDEQAGRAVIVGVASEVADVQLTPGPLRRRLRGGQGRRRRSPPSTSPWRPPCPATRPRSCCSLPRSTPARWRRSTG